LDSLFEALKRLKSKRFMDDCWYGCMGAWHEWESWQIEMAVPMSPDQVLKNVMQYFTISLKKME
jgi:glucosamine-6-phosphate deaminase